jgi:hypothetical protein
MKDKRLRLSSLHNPAPLLPVEFATHDLLVKGGFVRFNISPRLTCAKLNLLLRLHDPRFPELAQPLAHIFNAFVVDM